MNAFVLVDIGFGCLGQFFAVGGANTQQHRAGTSPKLPKYKCVFSSFVLFLCISLKHRGKTVANTVTHQHVCRCFVWGIPLIAPIILFFGKG
ncbi:MAG: hypothetical protein IPN04_04120 [Rhodoferax sp.]|nr:hypothetical protein [Rhodoferax sp.]